MGPGPGGSVCPPPAQRVTTFSIFDRPSAQATITGAWLTDSRNITVDAVYADLMQPGEIGIGMIGGYPPASQRHPADGTVVPAGANVEVAFTLTSPSSPHATGEEVRYTSGGQSYTWSSRLAVC
jgi:hypothetical protein